MIIFMLKMPLIFINLKILNLFHHYYLHKYKIIHSILIILLILIIILISLPLNLIQVMIHYLFILNIFYIII